MDASPERIPQEYLGNLTTYLGWDNERMAGLLATFIRHAEAREWDEAREQFTAFAAALDRHIRIEEEIVFPLFERASWMTPSQVRLMQLEHEEILCATGGIGGALAHQLIDAVLVGVGRLEDVLEPHNAQEERVIYPVADRAMTPLERRRVMARVLDYR